MPASTGPVYERRAVNGARSDALPVVFVATTRSWYSPVKAREPVQVRPFHSTF
jgi:hypothetical protein